jgi:hypothetical protein
VGVFFLLELKRSVGGVMRLLFWSVFLVHLLFPVTSLAEENLPNFDDIIKALKKETPTEEEKREVRRELERTLDDLIIERDEERRNPEGQQSRFFMPFCARALQGYAYECLILPRGEIVIARFRLLERVGGPNEETLIIVGRVRRFFDGHLVWNFSSVPYQDGWSRFDADDFFVGKK